ncbi:hypothetical protein EDC23_2361 [Thiohalophilus thiocyanatoxydans]|uniref:Uncharacterized protein n=1 Tax=Thiohalophilus thiocyanatoxydans TaxID=381308 RepID=A0A4R8IH85_9GAMM|nr:hypothetical protein EDC23_2361 [Thiohalophilus thiocyanatoxydans]
MRKSRRCRSLKSPPDNVANPRGALRQPDFAAAPSPGQVRTVRFRLNKHSRPGKWRENGQKSLTADLFYRESSFSEL